MLIKIRNLTFIQSAKLAIIYFKLPSVRLCHIFSRYFYLTVKALIQGRRRLFESGTAIERRRRSPTAEVGGEHERVTPPVVRGVWGMSPKKIL